MNKELEQKQIEELSDMAQLGSLLLSVADDVIAELFKDFMRNLEEKENEQTN
ncbi:MAG: hypothetical protein QXM38_04705 [Candidatus Aenigmatarchaeota archaeon]